MSTGRTVLMIAGGTALGICLFCGGCYALLATGGVKVETGSGNLDKESTAFLSRGKQRGLRPALDYAGRGTPVYEWNPRTPEIPPKLIGRVDQNQYPASDRFYTRVLSDDGKESLLDIDGSDWMYWMKD